MSYGIDFSGGRNYIVQFDKEVDTEEVRQLLEGNFDDAAAQVISIGTNKDKVRISTKYLIEDTSEDADLRATERLYEGLKPVLGDNVDLTQFTTVNLINSQKVGPTVADDIKVSSIWAVLISLALVALYIFIRFNDLGFSLGALASLAHDVVLIIGTFALLWGILPFSMEVDQSFIAALLTYVGFSTNDTVVIFDRIRENKRLYPKRDEKDIINEALNDTLSRTFSTSASVMVVLIAIFFFGGDTIRGFIFAMLLGTIFGVYSTLFVAVPIAYDFIIKERAHKQKKLELAAARK